MERIILDFALLLMAIAVPLHILLSVLWRAKMASVVDGLLYELGELRLAIDEPEWTFGVENDAPDMIAILGARYAPQPAWRPELEKKLAEELASPPGGFRDLNSRELADLLIGNTADPLGR